MLHTDANQPAREIRTVLISTQLLIRKALRSLLESLDHVTVVADVRDVPEALATVPENRPDIILLDVGLSGKVARETILAFKDKWPACQMVLLHQTATFSSFREGLQSAALGQLSKDCHPSELQAALDAVASGNLYVSPSLLRLTSMLHEPMHSNPLTRLTPRQRDILPRLANGDSSKAIAAELGIAARTVDTHRAAILQRLGISDTVSLVRLALQYGLIPPVPAEQMSADPASTDLNQYVREMRAT